MPFDRRRYPSEWDAISARIRLRAAGQCEGPLGPDWSPPPERSSNDGRCQATHGNPHPVTGSKVILTVAHVHDPDPMNCSDSNLAAVCQRCHLNHDRAHHIQKARQNRAERRAAGDLFLGAYALRR